LDGAVGVLDVDNDLILFRLEVAKRISCLESGEA
jgi:hypothetical protein